MKCTAIIKNLVPSLISGTILVSSPMVLACDNYSYSTCSICDTVDSFEKLLYEAQALAICILKDFRSLSENEKIDEQTANKLVLVCGFVIEICNNLGSPFKKFDTSKFLNNVEETVPINIKSLHSLYDDAVPKKKAIMHDHLSSDFDTLVRKLKKLSCLSEAMSLKLLSSPEYFCSNFFRLQGIYCIVLEIEKILDEKGVIINHVDVDKMLEYSDKLKVASDQYSTEDE